MITFIIPSISRSSLPRALQSLIAQTNQDWLAIVVFDGHYNELPVNDPRILFTWTTEKLGTGNAASAIRMQGIKLARTEWVAFLDDDDTVHQEYVETIHKALDDKSLKNSDLLIYRMQWYSGSGNITPPYKYTEASQLELGMVGISMVARRSMFDEIEWGGNWCEDWDLVKKIRDETDFAMSLRPEIMYRVRW